jgi:peptidoglycan/LPS O-acetylase OafA/YrhL
MKLPDRANKYFPGLDGLRGISCLIVVLTHNFGFSHFFEYGWLGVDLFFVISGFLITTILLDTLGSENYLKSFYIRRVLRIFPLYYLILVIFIFILPHINSFKENLQYFVQNQWWFWLYGQNWLLIFNFPKGAEHLNHFWSLAVEEQFYLVWPFIILWLKTPRRLIVFILLALVGLFLVRSFLWYLKIDNFNYTLFYRFTRVDGICIGALCALIYKVRKNLISENIAVAACTLAALNFLFYFLNKFNHFNYPYLAYVGYTTFSALLGLLLNEVIQNKSKWFQFIFTFPLLRFVGKISYGLYAIHWPVFLMTHDKFFNLFQNKIGLKESFSTYSASICATALGFILSILSYYYFEKKFLSLKKRFRY